MELALMEPVMKELGIDKDAPQVPELRKLAETYFAETGKEFQRMRHDQIEVEIANPFRIAPTVQAKIDPELKKLLTPSSLQGYVKSIGKMKASTLFTIRQSKQRWK